MKIIYNLYKILFIICTLYYCVVQSNPEIVQKNNDKTVRSANMENQHNGTQSAQSVKNTPEKDVSDPVSNARKQLSIFVSLINSAILGEAVVQNLTTFGEIGVNLMLMKNMPDGEDWVSSAHLNKTVMEETDKLRGIIEQGFDENISVDVIDKVMRVIEKISSFDSLDQILNASDTIQRVFAMYPISFNFRRFDMYKVFNLLGTLSKLSPIVTRLFNDSKPIDSIVTGSEFIFNYSNIDGEKLREGYESCKNSLTSDECQSVLRLHQNISFENVSIDDIETMNVFLDFYVCVHDAYYSLKRFFGGKVEITYMYEKLSKVQNLIGILENYGDYQEKISKLLSSLNELNVEKQKLIRIAETLEVLRPVSKAIAQMQELYPNNSRNGIRTDNNCVTNVCNSYRGLSKGIFTLNELLETSKHSRIPPRQYQESKVVRRTQIMQEFTSQRGTFLKFSKGVKSVQQVLMVIKSIEAFFSRVPELTSLGNIVTKLLEYYKKIQLLENIPDEIKVLKDIENQLSFFNETNIETLTPFTYIGGSTIDYRNIFSPLPRVIKSVKEVNILIKHYYQTDKKILSEAIAASNLLSDAIIKNKKDALDFSDVQTIKTDVGKMFPLISQLKKRKLPIFAILNSWDKLESEVGMMKNTPFNTSEYSQLVSSLKELKKLKSEIPDMPSRKEIDDLKSMLTELNSLKPLNITLPIRHEIPSHQITILMKGTPYGSNILGRLSNELNEYLWLTEGISSIQDFENGTVEGSVRELLIGVDAIQVVVARNNFSAYDIFNDSKMIDNRFRKLVKYLDDTEEKILRSGARPGIEEKVDSALAYDFLSKFQKSVSRSMNSFRRDIWWILMVLEHGVDCDKETLPICENDEKAAPTPKDDIEAGYFMITAAVFVLSCVVFITAVSCNNTLMMEELVKPEEPEPETIVDSTFNENVQSPENAEAQKIPKEDVRADGGTEYSTDYSIFSEV